MWKSEVLYPLGPRTAIEILPAKRRFKSRSIQSRTLTLTIGIFSYATRFQFIPLSCFLLMLCGCGQVNLKSANAIVATTNTVTFGTVVVGRTATATVGFQNHGLEPIQISATNTDSQLFAIQRPQPAGHDPFRRNLQCHCFVQPQCDRRDQRPAGD